MKFFKCKICGKVIEVLEDTGLPTICCGQEMMELIPCSTDGAHERHVPVFTQNGNTVHVKVGEDDHPMMQEHYIQWIAIESDRGFQRKNLKPGQKPMANFVLLQGEEVKAVYAYCNLHLLWMLNVDQSCC